MANPFDGTWRPRYEPPGPDAPPDVVTFANGVLGCPSCRPAYEVLADGQEHAVTGNPRFATLQVIVVDAATVRLVGRRAGSITYESNLSVEAAGNRLVETRTALVPDGDVLIPMQSVLPDENGGQPRPVVFRIASQRVGSALPGAHLVAGLWRVVELDLLHHDEDTTYRLEGDRLEMSDRLGRSFVARLDGSIAPYHGDPRITGVRLRRIEDRTIEETDLIGDVIVQVVTWRADVDGRTMHVQFDDQAGHVMEQSGYRVG